MNNSIDIPVLLTAKAKKVIEFNRIIHAQPSVFRINSFSRRISLSWNQALINDAVQVENRFTVQNVAVFLSLV